MLRAHAHNENVIGFFHHSFRNERRILDFLDGADGSGLARRSVHHAGIQLDDAVFIGQAAVAHGIVVGIVFDLGHNRERGVQRIATGFEQSHSVIEMLQAVCGRNNQRTNALRCSCGIR